MWVFHCYVRLPEGNHPLIRPIFLFCWGRVGIGAVNMVKVLPVVTLLVVLSDIFKG